MLDKDLLEKLVLWLNKIKKYLQKKLKDLNVEVLENILFLQSRKQTKKWQTLRYARWVYHWCQQTN